MLICLLLAAVSVVKAQMDYNYPTLWNAATLVNTTVRIFGAASLACVPNYSASKNDVEVPAGALQRWKHEPQGDSPSFCICCGVLQNLLPACTCFSIRRYSGGITECSKPCDGYRLYAGISCIHKLHHGSSASCDYIPRLGR